jgi:hypothetical protein
MVLVIRSSVSQPCRILPVGWLVQSAAGWRSVLAFDTAICCLYALRDQVQFISLLVAALSSVSQCASLPGCWLGQLTGHVKRSTLGGTHASCSQHVVK